MFDYCPNCGQTTVNQESKTKYSCTNCDWVFWNNPKTATAVVISNGSEILFAQRAHEPYIGKYDLPGGFVEFGEDIYAAAAREISEETGITLAPEDLEIVHGYTTTDYAPHVSTADIVLLAQKWSGKPRANDDVGDIVWKPISFINDPDFCRPYNGLVTILEEKLKNEP